MIELKSMEFFMYCCIIILYCCNAILYRVKNKHRKKKEESDVLSKKLCTVN